VIPKIADPNLQIQHDIRPKEPACKQRTRRWKPNTESFSAMFSRQEDGFKNVSLGNVLSAASPSEKITFLSDADIVLFKEWRGKSFEVQVAIHELLGHGSGKLLKEVEGGGLNFDTESVKHPITGGKVETWYKEGETWDAKFGAMSSSYEECRAECVGIYLCTVPSILSLFGHTCGDGEVVDVIYGNWLIMVRAGLLALEFYTPSTKQWRQAHMQARYCILKVLLEAGQGLVSITGKGAEAVVSLDRSKILTVTPQPLDPLPLLAS